MHSLQEIQTDDSTVPFGKSSGTVRTLLRKEAAHPTSAGFGVSDTTHIEPCPLVTTAGPAVLNCSYTLSEASWCKCQRLHQGNSTSSVYTSFTSELLSSSFKRMLSCLNQQCLLLYIVTEMGPSSQ